MKTFYYSPPFCQLHDPNPGHPECLERLASIDAAVEEAALPSLVFAEATAADKNDLLLAHTQRYVDYVFENMPTGRSLNFLDPDTVLCAESKDAALHAVGAVLQGVKAVLENEQANAFCAVRPPGHHAHRTYPAGFCLFNNVAIGALSALENHQLKRVAILDFDVHHGDGTQDIVKDNPAIFFASTYQYPLYASDSMTEYETGVQNNVVNKPFPAGTSGREIINIWKSNILPLVKKFNPEMIFVSAGFDGHRDDPLAQLNFTTEDYAELMQAFVDLAATCCNGRLVAVLEGGYNLEALADSVVACLKPMGK